jgi:hypothetical protein
MRAFHFTFLSLVSIALPIRRNVNFSITTLSTSNITLCIQSPELSAPCAQASSAAHSPPPKRVDLHGHPSRRHHASPKRSKKSLRSFKSNQPVPSALRDQPLLPPTPRHQLTTLSPTRTAMSPSLRAQRQQWTCSHS